VRFIKQSPDHKRGVSVPDKPKNAEKNLEKTDKFLKKCLQKSGQRLQLELYKEFFSSLNLGFGETVDFL